MRSLLQKKWFRLVFLVGFILWFGSGSAVRGFYCSKCGLLKKERLDTWFGFAYYTGTRLEDTEYHKLYHRYITSNCPHRWTRYYRSTLELGNGLFGGGAGSSEFPGILLATPGKRLAKEAKGCDRQEIIALLKIYDLRPSYEKQSS